MSSADAVRTGLAVPAAAVRRLSRRTGDRVVAMHEADDAGALDRRIAWLQRRYELVSLDALFAHRPGALPRVALTFDDGYRSWTDVTAPLLVRHRVPATFFVCSGLVGAAGADRRRFVRERLRRGRDLVPIDRRRLRELAADPLFEIGGHGATHADPDREPVDLDTEIDADRARLSEWTDTEVRRYAYAFGTRRQVTAEIVAHLEAGPYEAAFTTQPGDFDTVRPFEIGRTMIEPGASDARWAAWLAGGWDVPYRVSEVVRTAGRRVRGGAA